MQFNQAHINTIINAKNNDNLVIFVGAGVSKFSETNSLSFPFWGDIINVLKKDLDTEESDYLKVAQLYYLQFGEYSLYEKLKSLIPLHASSSEIHERIFELNPKYVITTNWDNILESTIEKNGHIYDIIKSDADLIKSILPRKLLKVHGDFSSHNIVFKEDDYLQYSDNFPLIENFLRHILSSYTILFLGYSYSDYDLKVISKWIERRSNIAPPRFILSISENIIESMYLKSHGIQSVFPIAIDNEKFFEYRNVYKTFIDKVNSEYNIPYNLLSVIEGEYSNEEIEISSQIKIEVVNFLYENLKGLLEFNALLPEQITNVLSNCSVEYHLNCFGLWFHDGAMTTDYEERQRKIYKMFFNIIKSYDSYNALKCDKDISIKMTAIFKIFYLANCLYLTNNDKKDWVEVRKFLSETDISELGTIDLKYEKYLTFSHKNKEMMGVIKTVESNTSENLIVYENIIDKYNSEIYQNLKNKEFYKAIISMFNVDLIIKKIRYNFQIKPEDQREFNNLETKWRSKLDLYPASVKKHIKGLYEFLNFEIIHEFYHDANKEFLDLEKNYLINTNNYRSNDRSLQILRFFILNEIMIDEYGIFKDLMKIYVELKFRLMIKNNKSETNIFQSPLSGTHRIEEHDLFILVKYFEFKKLYELIHNILEYYESSGTYIDCVKHTKYLLTTFENLVSLYDSSRTGIFSDIVGKAITNLIVVNSIIEWRNEDLDKLIDLISLSFMNKNLPLDAYKALNKFIYYNFKLFNISSEKIKILLDIPLRKILSGGLKGLEFHSVSNDLGNLFGILAETDVKYENDILISQVIGSLKPLEDVDHQRKISKNVLIKYLYIVNRKTVNQLHSYIDSIRIKDWSNSIGNELLFEELTFNMFGLKVNDKFINFLASNIEDYKRVTEEVGPRTREQQENLSRILDIPILFEFIIALSNKNIPEYIELQKKILS
ncbi:SIR2 family protein [Psychrobacter sp. NG254]|uniref:SIR2 family protein n=1 Tax=Psychrobacter sp. NG254 TaxID=2782003 RepID=UPI0018872F2C|nr:SIR2 family protein [Psychrobacter sp. NG254]MBF2720631.1 SIR2 family protein [Psychrobacter sp. NG254]